MLLLSQPTINPVPTEYRVHKDEAYYNAPWCVQKREVGAKFFGKGSARGKRHRFEDQALQELYSFNRERIVRIPLFGEEENFSALANFLEAAFLSDCYYENSDAILVRVKDNHTADRIIAEAEKFIAALACTHPC